MANERQQLDPIEEAMLELDAAEQAGVFQRTRLATRLLHDPQVGSAKTMRLARRLIPVVAAVLVIAVGVWSWMFSVELAELRERVHQATPVATYRSADGGAFYSCFQGPINPALVEDCRNHDYDEDGDVDLADFRTYQLAYSGPSH